MTTMDNAATKFVPKHDGPCPATIDLPCKLCELYERHLGYRILLAKRKQDRSGGKPGSELGAMLKALGFRMCGACAEMAARMDGWGVDGCREHRAEIVAWLTDQERRAGLLVKARAGIRAVSNKLAGGDLRGVRLTPDGLLDEAIRRAEHWKRLTLPRLRVGLGDAIAGMCAAHGYELEHPDDNVEYAAAATTVPVTSMFDHGLSLRNMLPIKGDAMQERGRNRIEGFCESIGVRMPRIPLLRNADELHAAHADYAGCWVLAPFVSQTRWGNRQWSTERWRTLHARLVADGRRVVIADNNSHRTALFPRAEIALALPPDRLMGLLLNAEVVISNDSGLAHLAGVLGRPTVVLCTITRGEDIFAFYPRAAWLNDQDRPLAEDAIVIAAESAVARAAAPLRVVTWHSAAYQPLHGLTWPTKQRWAEARGLDWFACRYRRGMDGWQQVGWWQEQLRQVPPGAWLWHLGADAAITGDGAPPTADDADVVLACDANGINSDSLLLRNVPAVHTILGNLASHKPMCRDEQQAMACELSGSMSWIKLCVALRFAPRTGGHAMDEGMKLRFEEALNWGGKVRVKVVPQRVMNAYPAAAYGVADSDEHWKPGDLVCHVPGVPLPARIAALRERLTCP